MATGQCNWLCFWRMAFAGALFCMLVISSSSEVKMSGQFDSRNSGANHYIMKSYFDEYKFLHDSSFEDFMAHQLSSNSCKVFSDETNMRLSIMEHSLVGDGSHRNLRSSIRLQIEGKSIPELPVHFCGLVIIQRLPHGVFADLFELQHLQERKVFRNAAVFGDTNLELPSFLSNRSVVEIHMDSGSNTLSRQNYGLKIDIQIPLHARYQPLDESGYSIVGIGKPDILMSCSMEDKQNKQLCFFPSPNGSSKSRMEGIVWRIPSGNRDHTEFVSVVTFFTAFLSTISIVVTSIFSSGKVSTKKI